MTWADSDISENHCTECEKIIYYITADGAILLKMCTLWDKGDERQRVSASAQGSPMNNKKVLRLFFYLFDNRD